MQVRVSDPGPDPFPAAYPAPVPDEVIDLTTGPVNGYLASPEAAGPVPGVVVLHEAFGLNDDIRRIADRFAANGYVALAPHLFGNLGLRCIARATRDLSRGEGPVVDQAEAVVEWLGRRPEVEEQRIGVAGFCMGGGLAFLLGVGGSVRAAAPNYGQPPKDLERLLDSCPVVASFGGRDRMFRRYAGPVEQTLERGGIPNDVVVYPEAGHSFMNAPAGHTVVNALSRPLLGTGFRPDDADDAWRRILDFFATHL